MVREPGRLVAVELRVAILIAWCGEEYS